ncbi:hypothetical protein KQI10_01765 [Pseudoflavonifractor sp. MSJ-30]|uniref:hypothetical protein n=1 Tax=Pseudoflavonifractor sp. MSJ-30 TaxID=2841525 RepID=UPI001C114498|nr:hypothetical protein [Pseudoflavonifractor sp. MSJ-30]MBU5451902.1 hypothetical protein [Pseudoflavonifractor sp. MSJ-30]
MTISEFNKAMNGIDDRFLSAWEERQKKIAPLPEGKGKYEARPGHRRLWVLVLAACLVIAMALTAYAANFMGIREAMTGTLKQVSPGEAAYITPETAAAESDAGWSCALTESLYTGEKIMLSVTIRAGEDYILIPAYINGSYPVGEIGLSGNETLQEYADRLGKTLLKAEASMDFTDWDVNGQGIFPRSNGTNELTLILSSEHTLRGPETLTGTCTVYVWPLGQEEPTIETLPLSLTAAPEPEGDKQIFHPVVSDSVPGMLFQDGTLSKSLSGYRLQLPFTVTDKGLVDDYLKTYCEELDLWGLLDKSTGNVFYDIPTNDFGQATIQIRNSDSEVVGTVWIVEQIG